MSHTITHALIHGKPIRDAQNVRAGQFRLCFKLGPYRLARARLDLTIVDLGDAAVSGEDVDLSHLLGKELLLRSVPERISPLPLCLDGAFFAYPFYSYERCWAATEGDFEAYLGSFSKTSRKGLRRRVKQLTSESGGQLDIRHFANGEIMSAFHADARAISAKTFQEKLMDDGLPAGEEFLRDIEDKARRDHCYGSILYLGEQPVSYLYCERQGAGWLAVYGGFDPAFAKLSPGTVHLLSVLEQSFNERDCELFDFGPGRSDYKQFFATDAVQAADMLILRKAIKNKLIVNAHGALGSITNWGAGLADRLDLKTKLRQKIRGR